MAARTRVREKKFVEHRETTGRITPSGREEGRERECMCESVCAHACVSETFPLYISGCSGTEYVDQAGLS